MKKLPLALLSGALVGAIYGLIEYAVVVVAPMVRWRPSSLGPNHWIWEAAFLLIYLLLGSAIGGAAIFRKQDSSLAATRLVAAAGLVALASGRLLMENSSPSNRVLALAFGLMAALICASLFGSGASIWRSWMCSPWVALPLMLAILQLKSFFRGPGTLSTAILGLWAAVSLVVWTASRSRVLRRALHDRFLPLTTWGCGILLAALVSTSVALDRSPRIPAARKPGDFPPAAPTSC